jgi:hypothetical protein
VKTFMRLLLFFQLAVTTELALAAAEVEFNDTPQTANPLSAGVSMNGQLYSKDDIDYFKMDVTGEGTFEIMLYRSGFTQLEVLNSSLQVVGVCCSYDGNISLGFDGPGTYYFRVSGATAGSYTLYVDTSSTRSGETEFNNTLETASALTSGVSMGGHLYSITDIDYYKILVGDSGSLKITVSGRDLKHYATALDVFNPAGQLIASSYVPNSDRDNIFYVGYAQSGTYHFKVSQTWASTFPYILTVEDTAPGTPIIGSATAGDGEIELLVAGNGNGSDATGYEATCSDGVNEFTATATTTEITVSGLTNGVTYVCTVVATNADGVSSPSAPTGPITPEAINSGVPIWLLYHISASSEGDDSSDGDDDDSSVYCYGAPAGVICDPNSDGRSSPGGTMDDWRDGSWGLENTPIPNGKVVAYPFLANAGAANGEARMRFDTYMPPVDYGYRWKGWFSETPGGAVLNNNAAYCREYALSPRTVMWWSQSSDPNQFFCDLGQAERVLYFNMEIGCYEEVWATVPLDQRDCTVGVPFPGVDGYPSYYIEVYPYPLQ